VGPHMRVAELRLSSPGFVSSGYELTMDFAHERAPPCEVILEEVRRVVAPDAVVEAPPWGLTLEVVEVEVDAAALLLGRSGEDAAA
jgi:hypothetical protein